MDLTVARAAEIRRAGCPVLWIHQAGHEQVVPLRDEPVSLGRSPSCDVVVAGAGVADRHCLVQAGEAGHEVFGLAAGCEVNGQAVEAAPLVNGDEIRFGNVAAIYVDPGADVMPPGLQLIELMADAPPPPSKAHVIAHQGLTGDFNDALLDALKKTPWVLVSTLLHALVYIVLFTTLREDEPTVEPLPVLEADLTELAEDDYELDEAELVEPPDEIAEIEPPEMSEAFEDVETAEPEPDTVAAEDELETLRGHDALGTGASAGDLSAKVGGQGRGGLDGAGVGRKLRSNVGRLKMSGLDLVFLLDATGSMDVQIEAAQRRVIDMITLIESLDISFRLGIVAFRDKGDEFVTRQQPLTSNRYKAVDFLDRLDANGGGDTPEAVYEAVREGAKMRWTRGGEKVMVLVGDAPPHYQTITRLKGVIRRFANSQGHFHTIYTETDSFTTTPISTRDVFRKLAEDGHGTAVELRDKRQLVEDILLLTLGSDDRRDIKKLIDAVDSGVKSQIFHRRFRSHDPEFARRQLSRKPLDPLVPYVLLKHNHVAFLPVYLGVLRDKTVPVPNRWLVTVLMRRLLEHVDRYQAIGTIARRVLDEFTPELIPGRQKRLLDKLAKSLFDEGILEVKRKGS